MSELHARQKLELIIRFMMAGDGSFKQRLSEAYRHPQMGLRSIPVNFFPEELRKEFEDLKESIDNNESKRLKNTDKMALMDEIFFLYKKLNDYMAR